MNDDTDITLHNYQDELTTDENAADLITQELTDDPTETLGVDPAQFKAELDQYDDDSTDPENEDRREEIEDIDGDESERS